MKHYRVTVVFELLSDDQDDAFNVVEEIVYAGMDAADNVEVKISAPTEIGQ